MLIHPETLQCFAIGAWSNQMQTTSKMEGPPLQSMERSQPIVNQWSRICFYFPQDADFLIWAPDRLIHHVSGPQIPDSSAAVTPEEASIPPLPPPVWEVPLTSVQLTSETPDEQRMDPPTRQMSQLCRKDIVPPNPLPYRRPPGHPAQATQLAICTHLGTD